MTGADADAIRAVARTARAPEDLPAADSLFAEVASVFGLRADAGYERARAVSDAIDLPR
jgi:hypothetical protein